MTITQVPEGTFDIRRQGHHVYIIEKFSESVPKTKLSLQNVITKAVDGVRKSQNPVTKMDLPYVHVFCDEFELTSLEESAPSLRWLRIVASAIRVPREPEDFSALNLKLPNISVLSIIAAHVPSQVTITLGKTSAAAIPLMRDPSSAIGVHYYNNSQSVSGQMSPIQQIAPTELSAISPRDFDSQTGTVRPRELLHFLFALFDRTVAREGIWLGYQDLKRPEHEIHAMKLIAMCTKDSPQQIRLHQQAYDLWRQLEIPSRTGYFVPKVGSASAKRSVDGLKDTLVAVNQEYNTKAVGDALGRQIDHVSNDIIAQVHTVTKTAIDATFAVAQTRAQFDATTMQSDLTTKQGEVEAAEKRLNEMQSDFDQKSKDFQAKLKQWKDKAEKQAREDLWFSIFEVAVDIGAAFFSGGLSLLKAAPDLSKSAEKFKKMNDAIQKTKKLENLGKLCEKFSKVHEARKVTQAFYDKWQHPDSQPSAADPDAIKKQIQRCVDAVKDKDGFEWAEAKMMWDDFEIDTEASFKKMESISIDGKEDYHSAFKKFLCRGRDMIVTQKEAQDLRLKAARAFAFQQLIANKAQEFTLTSATSINTASTWEYTKAILQDHIDSIRRSLFLEIHQWVLVWAYQNAQVSLPETLSRPRIDGTMTAFMTAINDIETEMNKTTVTNWQSSTTPLTLSTSDAGPGFFFEKGWNDMLSSEGQVQFLVPITTSRADPNSFVKSATVNIQGLQIQSTTGIIDAPNQYTKDVILEIEVQFGPVLRQRTDARPSTGSSTKSEIQFYADLPMTQKCRIVWDTHTTRAKAVFSGANQPAGTAVMPTLFSYARIRVLPLSVGETDAGYNVLKEWDFSKVSEISITLDIDFALFK